MKAEDLDQKFDEGGPVLEYFDLSTLTRPNQETECVDVEFPVWMLEAVDKEAKRLGIQRQSVIKTWIAQHLNLKSA